MSLPVLVSRNGRLVPPAQAHISVFNPALYGAYGVYESLQVVHGVVFALGSHLDRLIQSAAMLELPLPASRSTLEQWVHEVLEANRAQDCTLRILIVGSEDQGGTVAYLWPQPAPTYAPELYSRGAGAITFEGERALPGCKSLNTLVNALARRRASALGAHEALLYHDGQLTEGSNSNVFAVIDGEVLTPPAEQVLPGVTRDLILRLATQNGLAVREGELSLDSVSDWSECFITSTSRHIMPISAIDGRAVDGGRPGPLTQELAKLFEDYFAAATACRG